jgi:hypothetical protein
MTEITTTLREPQQAATAGPDLLPNTADILTNLIVAFLAPMFLGASGGDIGFARAAAIETVNAYRTRNHADLVSIAQIIAFGLAALGSLSLSMADDLSLPMILRLRGNANALDRSAERSRRALRESRGDTGSADSGNKRPDQPEAEIPPGADAPDEAALTAAVAAARQAAANVRARAAAAAPAIPATTRPTATQQHHQTTWAIAMADAAEKLTASIDALPPAERRAASLRAATLASTATSLLSRPPGAQPLDPIIRPQQGIR